MTRSNIGLNLFCIHFGKKSKIKLNLTHIANPTAYPWFRAQLYIAVFWLIDVIRAVDLHYTTSYRTRIITSTKKVNTFPFSLRDSQ